MRKQSIVVAATMILALALVTVAMAADPIIGTWKLNLEKSKFAPGQAIPKEQTEAYREIEGNQIELTFTSKGTNGSSDLLTIIFPAQGGVNKRSQGNTEGGSEIETRIGPGEWHMTRLNNGKQILVLQKAISKDGKTMRQTETGTDAKGKPYENQLVYDRQ